MYIIAFTLINEFNGSSDKYLNFHNSSKMTENNEHGSLVQQ